MNWKQQIIEDRRMAALGGVFVILLGFAALLFPGLSRLSFDLPFAFRPNIPVDDVVIVYIDEQSTAALGQPFDKPWDRSLHARLVRQLTKASAKAVVFDMLFDSAGTPQIDQDFANAIRSNGKIIVAAGLNADSFPALNPILPAEPIASVTRSGLAQLPLDIDGVVREHYPSPQNYPSLAEKAAEVAGGHLIRPEKQRWLNYYGRPGVIPSVSYFQAFDTNLAKTFTGKVVFVGLASLLTPRGTWGGIVTPYTRWTGVRSPDVEIQATAFLNLVRGDWLTRLPIGIEVTLIVAAGFVFGFGLSLLRSWLAAIVVMFAGIFAVAGGALELCWHTHIWFSWLVICVVQIPGAFVCFMYAQRKRRLSHQPETMTPSGDYFAA